MCMTRKFPVFNEVSIILDECLQSPFPVYRSADDVEAGLVFVEVDTQSYPVCFVDHLSSPGAGGKTMADSICEYLGQG